MTTRKLPGNTEQTRGQDCDGNSCRIFYNTETPTKQKTALTIFPHRRRARFTETLIEGKDDAMSEISWFIR